MLSDVRNFLVVRYTTRGRVATLFQAPMHTLTTTCLRIRIIVRPPDLWQSVHGRCEESDTYRTPHEEARYWHLAEWYRQRLYSGGTRVQAKIESGLRNSSSRVSAQLVEYYTPHLLLVYRERRRSGKSQEVDATFTISPKAYCKRYRVVFPDRVSGSFSTLVATPNFVIKPHPNLTQAARRIKHNLPTHMANLLDYWPSLSKLK
ncbi:hypothetical protein EDD16DRAFT_728015 [Pisolithus croceorrhizus]|nr:hypothetical protein EDD16DRAFT_728015 [Pisolithus croceorrhizus]